MARHVRRRGHRLSGRSSFSVRVDEVAVVFAGLVVGVALGSMIFAVGQQFIRAVF